MSSFPEMRSAFIAAARRAVSAGLQVSTGGNLSARVADQRFLVKPSGFSLRELGEGDLLVVDASGDVVEGGGKPTKEIRSHLGIYLARKDVEAVVHYHPPYSTAYAVCGREIPLKTVHARRILGKIPLVPAAPEGSDTLSRAVREVFSDPSVFAALLLDHGIMAAGPTLARAQNLAELVEECATIAYLSESLGAGTGISRHDPIDKE